MRKPATLPTDNSTANCAFIARIFLLSLSHSDNRLAFQPIFRVLKFTGRESCFRYANLILRPRVFPRILSLYIALDTAVRAFFTTRFHSSFSFLREKAINSSSYERIKRKTPMDVYTRACICVYVRNMTMDSKRVCVCVCMRACIRLPRPEGINFFAIGPLVGPTTH